MGFGIILLMLGIIGAQSWVNEKLPAATYYVDKLYDNRELVGAIGVVSGVIWAFDWLMGLPHFSYAPLHSLLSLAGALLSLGLGITFGYDFLLKGQKSPPSMFFVKLATVRAWCIPYQKEMALVGMGMGLLYFLVALVR